MAISLTEDFKTVADLRQCTDAILAQVRETGRPVSITLEGKPAVVLLDVKVFERMLRMLNLARLLGPAEEDLHAGRVVPLDQFMKEFRLANQIPATDHPGSSTGRSGNSQHHRKRQKKGGRKVGS